MKNKYLFQCTDCNTEYTDEAMMYLCPKCSATNDKNNPPKGVLKIIYDYSNIKKRRGFLDLRITGFIDLLPLKSIENLPKLQIGRTPLYQFNELNNEFFNFSLFLKDDSQNPTFSFKDRASALVSAFALENNIDTIIAASTGNAGSSLAGICAVQKQKAIVFVPAKAPLAKLTQIAMYGAKLVPVDGNYDQAFDISIEATKKYGWYNRNTAYNPFTIEGKKTVSFELYSQLGQNIPNTIFVPVGDGVIISGVYKGFEDLFNLGYINAIPKIIAVQSEGSNNLIQNLHSAIFKNKPSETIADSISVDIPRNYFMARKYIKQYEGETITVTDTEIIEASYYLSRNTGIFSEPAASAAFAGFLKYKSLNKIEPGTKNVVLLTGSGLKDLKTAQNLIRLPEPVKPDIDKIFDFLNNSN